MKGYENTYKIVKTTGIKAEKKKKKWSKELILLHLNMFFEQFQRIPKKADFNGGHSRGYLPFEYRLVKHFTGKSMITLYYEWESAINKQ